MLKTFPIGNATRTVCVLVVVGFSLTAIAPASEINFSTPFGRTARGFLSGPLPQIATGLRQGILRELATVGDCQVTAHNTSAGAWHRALVLSSRSFKADGLNGSKIAQDDLGGYPSPQFCFQRASVSPPTFARGY